MLLQLNFVFLLLSLVWFVMTCTTYCALCDNFCEIFTSRSSDRDAILTNTFCMTLYISRNFLCARAYPECVLNLVNDLHTTKMNVVHHSWILPSHS